MSLGEGKSKLEEEIGGDERVNWSEFENFSEFECAFGKKTSDLLKQMVREVAKLLASIFFPFRQG